MSLFCRKKKDDVNFGDYNEDLVLPLLEYFFNKKLSKTDNYNTFDYASKDETMMIELKSRRNKRKTYPTTMVGFNKIEKSIELLKKENGGYEIYFVFNFTDSIAYYKFEHLNENWKRKGGRKDRGKTEFKDYYYIPVTELKTIIKRKK